jgi:hypothetical protein
VNPRPVEFAGVERPNTDDPAWLRADLMREHAAVRVAVRDANQRFVPRLLPVTMGAATISAKPWDFIIAVDGGTIYLPKLQPVDDGDEVHVAVESGSVTVVSDMGLTIVGSATVTGPSRSRFTWAGAKWWVG